MINIDMHTSFVIAPFIMLLIALYKKTGVAAWLSLGMCFGLLVAMSEPTDFQAMVWACCCNSILVYAMTIHFRQTKMVLPVLMSIALLSEVFFGFFNLISIANGLGRIEVIGWFTGVVSYIQIFLVLIFNDKKGSLSYVLDDILDFLGSAKRFISSHKH